MASARLASFLVPRVCCRIAWGPRRRVETRRPSPPKSDYIGIDLRSEQTSRWTSAMPIASEIPPAAPSPTTPRPNGASEVGINTLKPFSAPSPSCMPGKAKRTSRAAGAGFFPRMADQARQYRTHLTGPGFTRPAEGLSALTQEAGQAAAAGDHRAAMQKYEAALSAMPDDGALWLRLARETLATQPADGQETSTLPAKATSAAFNGYNFTRTASARAEALALLAAGLDRRDLYRAAQAYEASLALVSSSAVRADYEDLKARKGFRIVDHSVDADTSAPRICAQFSEELLKTGVDYSQFVTVDGKAPRGVEAGDKQICVEGLEHGRHYDVTFRAGLPAAIGEVISAPVVLSIYVQDRGASARFTGDSFVLPSGARRGIPVVTVNMDAAEMKLYRIGDRALAQLLSGYQFLRQLDGYDISSISDQMGEPVWQGRMEIANEINKEVTTSFPVDEALPHRKPGVYVLTAQPVDDRSDDWKLARHAMVLVSDIGLSTFTGQAGSPSFARSLGSASRSRARN